MFTFSSTPQIKLVNINTTSIADGKPSIVLGLVWTIILYFQVSLHFTVLISVSACIYLSVYFFPFMNAVLTPKYGDQFTNFTFPYWDFVSCALKVSMAFAYTVF